MNLFNRFFLVVIIIFFLGCKNNSYNSIEISNIQKNKKTNVTDQIIELKEEVKENITLTDENVIDFFLHKGIT